MLSVLLDPDSYRTTSSLIEITDLCNIHGVDFIFIGGSHITSTHFDEFVEEVKEYASQPVIIFPGSQYEISDHADAILLLSLISGRNPEYLIGQHVSAATRLKKSRLNIIPTGYMLMDGGNITTASYITQTIPIPCDKSDLATSTALAGEQLGMKMIYMDAGSGAKNTINEKVVKEVKNQISIPLITGGGVRTAKQLETLFHAGSDIVVVGNRFETSSVLINDFCKVRNRFVENGIRTNII